MPLSLPMGQGGACVFAARGPSAHSGSDGFTSGSTSVHFNLVTWLLLSKTHRKCFPGLPWRHAPSLPGFPRIELQLITGKEHGMTPPPGRLAVPSSGLWVLSALP